LERNRRFRRLNRRSAPSQRRVEREGKGEERRANHAIRMFFSLLLLGSGGLTLWVAQETDAMVRRFLNPAIESASALRGAEQGQSVILRGRIDPKTSDLHWGLAIFDHEHLDPPPLKPDRLGGRDGPGPSTWGRRGGHHPPFTLVTSGERVPIINGHYAIERPRSQRQTGQDRYVGFLPDDEVLVIGEIEKGGVHAHRVFGGTPEDLRETLLMNQRIVVPLERILGCLLMGLSLVLVAPWVRSRIRGRVLES
jgi:hypothetical protein